MAFFVQLVFGEVRVFVLLAALQIRHFIDFVRAFKFSARTYVGAVSRGAHMNLEAHRVVDISLSVNRLDGTRVCLCASRRYVRSVMLHCMYVS